MRRPARYKIVREGAQRMLDAALRADVAADVAHFADERNEKSRRLVGRNGYHKPREVPTPAGAIEVHAPQVERQAHRPANR